MSIWYDTESVRQYSNGVRGIQILISYVAFIAKKIREVRKVSLNIVMCKNIKFPIICFVIPILVLNGFKFCLQYIEKYAWMWIK